MSRLITPSLWSGFSCSETKLYNNNLQISGQFGHLYASSYFPPNLCAVTTISVIRVYIISLMINVTNGLLITNIDCIHYVL